MPVSHVSAMLVVANTKTNAQTKLHASLADYGRQGRAQAQRAVVTLSSSLRRRGLLFSRFPLNEGYRVSDIADGNSS